MALQWKVLGTQFDDSLYHAILKLEAPRQNDRLNGLLVQVKPGVFNFTIGVGVDLVAGDKPAQDAVMRRMGFHSRMLERDREPESDALGQKEFGFINRIRTALKNHKGSADLDVIMKERADAAAADPAYATYIGGTPRPTFVFNDETEVRDVFNTLWTTVYSEKIFKAWPELEGDTAFTSSREMIALASMTWNGGGNILGAKLRDAVVRGDRAEAWFQIRYASNKSRSGGLAARRFVEAELFGLYDDPAGNHASAEEAKKVYAMFTRYREEIFAYEALLGEPADGTAAVKNRLGEAATDAYKAAVAIPQTLVDSLIPAREALIAWINSELPAGEARLYGTDWNPAAILYRDAPRPSSIEGFVVADTTLDARAFDGMGAGLEKNIVVGGDGNDFLSGGKGDDLLVGGKGRDYLQGGAGNDTLYGGEGFDTYVIDLRDGEGRDRIIDSDGQGQIIVIGQDGELLSTTVLQRQGTSNAWTDAEGKLTLSHNSPWRLTFDNGSVVELGDFDPAGFGITLVEAGAATSTTITGDFRKATDESGSSYLHGDSGYASAGEQAGAADILLGGASGDRILGLGGNDGLAGFAGDDYLDGGEGSDVLLGGLGRDELHGGAGDDFLIGSGAGGFDHPYSVKFQPPLGEGTEVARGFAWLAYDPPGADSNGRNVVSFKGVDAHSLEGDVGNVIEGGAGNDYVAAGSGADSVHGGDDDDLIKGMHGNDVLFGDAGNDKVYGDGPQGNYVERTAFDQHGRDMLVGGTGNDTLVGQGGSDELYGGDDDDRLIGDELPTGEIDDTPVAYHGNDYLDGGAGKDYLEGDAGDDLLFGGEGDDSLLGDARGDQLDGRHHGNDLLNGEDGNDYLEGGGGNDELFGGNGNDSLQGDADARQLGAHYHGHDRLYGGAGDDTLAGGALADTLLGGMGADTLLGDGDAAVLEGTSHGDDYLDGGEGDDYLQGDGGADLLIGGEGEDTLRGDASSPALALAVNGADTLEGGAGDDVLIGGGGADELFGGDDADILRGDDTTDIVAASGHGNDYLDGGAGNDGLYGGGGDDELIGGEGDDWLAGEDQSSTTATSLLIGNDSLRGEAGADTLIGGNGRDYLDGGSDDDVLWGGEDRDTLIGGSGADSLDGGRDRDSLEGGDGGDHLAGGSGTDTLLGGAGADHLDGGSGADILDGGEGNDTLLGGAGDDLLHGGEGADYLDGGRGNDIFSLSLADMRLEGESIETIVDGQGDNTLKLEVAKRDVFLKSHGEGGDALLSVDADHAVVIRQAAGGTLREIEFADGWVVSFDRLMAESYSRTVVFSASAADSKLFGGSQGDTLTATRSATRALVSGGRGDDTLRLEADGGTTVLFSLGDGVDRVISYASRTGENVLRLGAGISLDDLRLEKTGWEAFRLSVGKGGDALGFRLGTGRSVAGSSRPFDRIVFSEGAEVAWEEVVVRGVLIDLAQDSRSSVEGTDRDDVIVGSARNRTIDAWTGDDRIQAGAGDETLVGGQGNDTYTFTQGFGRDVVDNLSGTKGETDRIVFDKSLPYTQALFTKRENDLLIRFAGKRDALRILGFYSNAGQERIEFADGHVFDHANPPVESLSLQGLATPADDTLALSDGNDDFDALAGNDDVDGGEGNDTLSGGAGNDSLRGGGGDDALDGGEGDDSLQGGAGNDTLVGGGGYDTLEGGEGNDVLRGSRGRVIAGSGDDLVQAPGATISLGSGNDTVVLTGERALTVIEAEKTPVAGEVKTLRFNKDVSPDMLRFTRKDTDLHVKWLDAELVIRGFVELSGADGGYRVVFEGAPDVVWTHRMLLDKVNRPTEGSDTFDGTAGDDVIDALGGHDTVHGGGGNDRIIGGAGNDELHGDAGNDELIGGEGFDELYGGAGDDVLSGEVMEGGAGHDTYRVAFEKYYRRVSVTSGEEGGDAVVFEEPWAPEDIRVRRYGESADLYLEIAGTDRTQLSLVLKGQLKPAGVVAPVAEVRFAARPGAVWTSGDLLRLAMTGDWHNDDLRGLSDQANTLEGRAGDDYLRGGRLADFLEGGEGRDTLAGGDGDDTYLFGPGFGSDRLIDSQGANVIRFREGIAPSDIRFVRTGQDASGAMQANDSLIVMVESTGDQIWVDGFFRPDGVAIGTFVFADGTTWAYADVASRTGASISGSADIFTGTSGNDVFRVDHAADRVVEQADGGEDTVLASVSYRLPDGVENIELTGTAGIDAFGNSGDNLLKGNAGSNILNGGGGTDVYFGGKGNDTYRVFEQGSGWDRLRILDLHVVAPDVHELAGEGYDTLETNGWAVRLPDHVERLVVPSLRKYGSIEVDGGTTPEYRYVGNALDNVIDLSQADFSAFDGMAVRIDGGAGADTLIGTDLNDTYVVDSLGDVIVERAVTYRDGVRQPLSTGDTVEASISYSLENLQAIENLRLSGDDNIDAVGNAYANVLEGNSGNNLLDGRAGSDTMSGGSGNDTYIVDDEGDVIRESVGGGRDKVISSVSYRLSDQVEELFLVGTKSIDGTGNASSNRLTGNDAANVLDGSYGHDVLDGKGGNDTLIGDGGNDTFLFGRDYGVDTLVDYELKTNFDEVVFGEGIAVDQLWLQRQDANLAIGIIGTSDRLVVQDWYLGPEHHIEKFKSADGKTLLDSQVQNLVDAMASFAPPAAGQTHLPDNYRSSLEAVIAANWQ